MRRMMVATLFLLLTFSSIGTAATEDAAHVSPDPAAPTQTGLRTLFRDLRDDFRHLPSIDSAAVASIGGGLALGVHPLDDDVDQTLASEGGFFKAGHIAGNTAVLMGASMTTYGLGRAFGQSRMVHIGMDLLRAQIVTEAMVQP